MMKGSEMIIPVIFKTKATQQYGAVREFRRRVRLALEQNHLLPGDPNRVFNTFIDKSQGSTPRAAAETVVAAPDPTTLKPQESNPFKAE
jgi:small conductance mechanosensitive channel